MRITASRLALSALATALAAGLLTSVLVRPEPALTAADNCYGPCPDTTTLSLSSATVTYGDEEAEVLSVDVSADDPGAGAPTGEVIVLSETGVVCRIHLTAGKGSCTLSPRDLPPGSDPLIARYLGGHGFRPSESRVQVLDVQGHVRHRRHERDQRRP